MKSFAQKRPRTESTPRSGGPAADDEAFGGPRRPLPCTTIDPDSLFSAWGPPHSAWLWFFMGFLFNIVTVLVLLSKNADDRQLNSALAAESGIRAGSPHTVKDD
jgi:hypothetical protein